MTKKYQNVLFVFFVFLFFAGLALFTFLYFQRQDKPSKIISYFNIKSFGNLSWGNSMIYGPGDYTLAPYLRIPHSKFYVAIIKDDDWCVNEDCGLQGALIQTMGGWLQVNALKGNPDLPDEVGFDFFNDQNIKSIVIVGGESGKIVGIYLNKGLDDVLDILKNHPDLANFNLLSGAIEFGKLKVGDMSPLKPGDSISNLSRELSKFSITNIPKGKNFYFYALQNKKYNPADMYESYESEYVCIKEAGCRYPEPDISHDFLFDNINRLGGWFLSNDKNDEEIIKLFGLDTNDVISSKLSLVILTDAKGIIVALHPYKTIGDAITILSQHPNLADINELY